MVVCLPDRHRALRPELGYPSLQQPFRMRKLNCDLVDRGTTFNRPRFAGNTAQDRVYKSFRRSFPRALNESDAIVYGGMIRYAVEFEKLVGANAEGGQDLYIDLF